MVSSRLFFRADASARIGHGHVTRLAALADMLPDFDRCFLSVNPPPAVSEQLLSVVDELIELPFTKDKIGEARHLAGTVLRPGDLIVLDGYEFTSEYQRIIRSAGVKLIYLDDLPTISPIC